MINMFKKTVLSAIVVFLSLFTIFAPQETFAIKDSVVKQSNGQMSKSIGFATDTAKKTDPRIFISSLIKIALSLIGSIFLVLLLMSGYWLVIARGREDYIEKAQKTALRAVVGIIIVLLSYSITVFVTSALTDATDLKEGEKKKNDKMLHQLGY